VKQAENRISRVDIALLLHFFVSFGVFVVARDGEEEGNGCSRLVRSDPAHTGVHNPSRTVLVIAYH